MKYKLAWVLCSTLERSFNVDSIIGGCKSFLLYFTDCYGVILNNRLDRFLLFLSLILCS